MVKNLNIIFLKEYLKFFQYLLLQIKYNLKKISFRYHIIKFKFKNHFYFKSNFLQYIFAQR